MAQNYNSESDEEQYEIDGFSDDPAIQNAQIGWIKWFCSLEGHEFLVEIDEDYIRDPFNLQGLQEKFTKEKMKTCLRMILSPQQPNEDDLNDEAFLELNQESSDLYSLMHARFINSPRGLAKVYQKFLNGTYGTCPRALCDRQKVLPVGLSDSLRTSRFKNFCPRCEEVYLPKTRQVNVDGACFGSSFPQVFLMHYPMAVILPPKVYHYEPKIFGFKIHGKRGSKAFNPPKGNVHYIAESMQQLELEKLREKGEEESCIVDFSKQLSLDKGSNDENTAVTGEDNDAKMYPEANRNKKNRKKNKK